MSTSGASAKHTPLYQAHRDLGGKLIDFGGWMLPVNYGPGIIEEHKATRSAVGVFDVSHMGEVHFRGPDAAKAVQRLVTNDVGKLTDGRALYTVACNPKGGIVDDLIVYRVDARHFLLVVNAANIAKDHRWFVENAGSMCEIHNASDETALISFQGPKAAAALAALAAARQNDVRGLPPFHFLRDVDVAGVSTWIARTGYTGEDGFELFCAPADAPKLWTALLGAATAVGGLPVGLGARDTLRLEARLSLYGNDLTDDTTPYEAGLAWVVKPDAGDFIGKSALLAQQQAGLTRKLAGFVMRERGIPRHGYAILDSVSATGSAQRIGEVTSGTVGPTIGQNIGLGYVPTARAEPGNPLVIDCRGKPVMAEVVKGPFYRRQNA